MSSVSKTYIQTRDLPYTKLSVFVSAHCSHKQLRQCRIKQKRRM